MYVCEDDPQIFEGMFRCVFEYGLKEKEGFLEHGFGLAAELGAVKERGGSRGCCSAYGLGKPPCCELVHNFQKGYRAHVGQGERAIRFRDREKEGDFESFRETLNLQAYEKRYNILLPG